MGWGQYGKDMSGKVLIKDDSCILKEVDEDKSTSGIVFRLNSEVL